MKRCLSNMLDHAKPGKFFGHSRCDNPCEIAELIYQSQTACYASDRESAIDDLGDYDCMCHPEIMCAMIYALNDADEGVREEAADEIGDMLEDNACCCTPEVVAALTRALADCDKGVRRQAEEALEICGYRIVDGCCRSCGGCSQCAAHGAAMDGSAAPQAAPPADRPNGHEAVPAPAPPAEPRAYFPSRRLQTSRNSVRPVTLAGLFGLAK
jgi:hypothetical protein